jgi:hypothetical protein
MTFFGFPISSRDLYICVGAIMLLSIVVSAFTGNIGMGAGISCKREENSPAFWTIVVLQSFIFLFSLYKAVYNS